MSEIEVPQHVLRAWTRLLRVHQRVTHALERALKAAGLPNLVWHDVLIELAHAPEHRLRPLDLVSVLGLAQYNLSRLMDRMEEAGMVARAPCDDRRGHWIVLTASGLKRQQAMYEVYAKVIMQEIGAQLDEASARKLARHLGKILPPAE